MRHLALLVLLLPSGCGEQSPWSITAVEGRLSREEAREEVKQILEDQDVDLVFAHSNAMARGAFDAAREMGKGGMHVIGVGGSPAEGREYLRDGFLDLWIEKSTGGREAVDLALLAMGEVTLHEEILLGTTSWTLQNMGDGGEVQPFVGAFVLEAMRHGNPDVLSTDDTGPGRAFAVLQCIRDEGLAAQTIAEIREQADRYPRLRVEVQVGGDDPEQSLRGLLNQGFGAIVVALGGQKLPSAAARDALGAGIPVIVLGDDPGSDDYTCLVRADDVTIGRAAGKWAMQRLGGRGRIVEITRSMMSRQAKDRSVGFRQGLDPEGAFALEPRR